MSETGNWARVPNQGAHYFLTGHRLSVCRQAVAIVQERVVEDEPRDRCLVCVQAMTPPDSDAPVDEPEPPAETEPKAKRQRKADK